MGSDGGGAERMICDLANALSIRGFTVHIVSWDGENVQMFYPLNGAVIWHRFGFQGGLRDKIRRAWALAGVLREYKIPVLVGFVMSGDKTVFAASRMARVRLVAAERNAPAMYHLKYSRYQRWVNFSLLHLCDRITVQFPEYAAGYPATLRKRIITIPNPVTPARELAHPDQPGVDGRHVLLAVGRLDGVQKGFACLIRAFACCAKRHSDWVLQLIGDGPQINKLRGLISEYKLDDRVFILPSVRDIYASYTNAHLFVIPSRWEGFPNVLAEAMSHGLPAVGFAQAAGVNNLIRDGMSGWLAEGLDNEKFLAAALSVAMGDASERSRRGRNAMHQMRMYEPEEQYNQWESLLDSLMGSVDHEP
jgi:glycosyltransferase involved in cell wall biosynthesis